jgi:predicted hotdog family 3-hydroxylacyl-ACP dehydratase
MSRIGRDEILTLIPHAGTMCLLDEVVAWDADMLRCLSHRFAAHDNPLRRAEGTLGAACGIEIAAQAMALHGRLTSPTEGAPVPGFLVSVRDVVLSCPLLDEGPLEIEVHCLMTDMRGASYNFTVIAQGATMLSGRATVMFGVAP